MRKSDPGRDTVRSTSQFQCPLCDQKCSTRMASELIWRSEVRYPNRSKRADQFEHNRATILEKPPHPTGNSKQPKQCDGRSTCGSTPAILAALLSFYPATTVSQLITRILYVRYKKKTPWHGGFSRFTYSHCSPSTSYASRSQSCTSNLQEWLSCGSLPSKSAAHCGHDRFQDTDAAKRLLATLTSGVNLMIQGKLHEDVRPLLYKASLIASKKKKAESDWLQQVM